MNATYNAKERPNKAASYDFMFDQLSTVTTALLMPSAKCIDVQYLMKKGVITTDTHLYVVERDDETHFLMMQTLKLLGFERGINLTDYCSDLFDVTGLPDKLDLCFLDFFGSIMLRDARWMVEVLSPCLKQQSRVCVTVQLLHRGNGWIEEFWNAMGQEKANIKDNFIETHSYENDFQYKPALWLKCIFNHFDFALGPLFPYSDGISSWEEMLSMRMDDFELRENSHEFLSNSDIEALMNKERVDEFYQRRDGETKEETEIDETKRSRVRQEMKTRLRDILKQQNKKMTIVDGEVMVLSAGTYKSFTTLYEACHEYGCV